MPCASRSRPNRNLPHRGRARLIQLGMKFDLEDSIALLERTPRVLDALLRDLPENWTATNEGEGTWSAFDVVGHLIHGDHSDWVPRARRILDDGESRAFEPFDREGHARAMAGKTLPMLLDEFARLRAEKIAELRAMRLQDADFERRGRHPALATVTLAQLLATWVTHDLTHLHQISRVLAHQYRDSVGPWSAYLGVLHCDGHSGN